MHIRKTRLRPYRGRPPWAQVVGRENVIAGADRGFASFSTTCEVHPTVVWAKLASLAEGARLATKELWGQA